MLSVAEAQRRILAVISTLPSVETFISGSVNRVLAEDIVAGRNLPAWDNSAMDGYAVKASEVTGSSQRLRVIATIPAGAREVPTLLPGTAARIFTGAPLPEGADTVMIQENTSIDGEYVTFHRAARHRENVRQQGEDAKAGSTVLSAGRVLSPGDINLLASLGRSRVSVYRRPKVAIISTGDELVEIDGPEPGLGQIINSNVYALAAAVQLAGGVPVITPPVPDNPESIRNAFLSARSADAIVTCGGMSVGDFDYVRDVLRELTSDEYGFWKVAIKPGKPIGFGTLGHCALFGLPGNPASAWVTFILFVRPSLLKMQGHTMVLPLPRRARLAHPLKAGGARQNYLRVAAYRDASGELWVDASRNQSSGALTSIANADGLAIVAPSAPAREEGDSIDVLLLNTRVDRHS